MGKQDINEQIRKNWKSSHNEELIWGRGENQSGQVPRGQTEKEVATGCRLGKDGEG